MAPLKMIKFICCGLICVCFLLINCTHSVVDGGTETGNAIGILYNPNGSRAANAKVYIVSVDHNPKPIKRIRAIDSTITDDTGAFVVDSVPEGYYNILGRGDSGISYTDSLFIDNDTIPTEVTDTLRESGTLRGVVRLQGDDDSRTVFILVFGTQTWTAPIDSIGNFTLTNMAEGTYHVRILTTLDDYGVLDTNLTITAETVDTLSDTIYLPFTGIPIPQGLTLAYDTLKQIVTLTWNACDTNLVKGYNVYRKHSDSDFVKINTAMITDITYSDSSAIQDETYEYKIKAVNMSDEEGEFSEGISITVLSTFILVDSIGEYGTAQNQVFMPRHALSYQNQYIILDVVDPYPSAVEAKFFDSTGNYIKSFTIRQSNVSDNVYTMHDAFDNQNNLYTVFKDTTFKHDINGNLLDKYALPIPELLSKTACLVTKDSVIIYAINRNQKTIIVRNLSGDTISSFTYDAASNNMNGIAVDGNGNIFVGDRSLHKIYKFDMNGNLLTEWGSQGEASDQFGRIEGIVVDNDGRLFVDDSENSRITIFSNEGDFITKFETFINTKKWQGTVNDNSQHLSIFISGADVCLLEGNAYKKLFVYKANSSLSF